VNLNVILPLASSILSLIFAVMLIDQWRERRRAYQLIWAVGMFWYFLSAGSEFLGGAFGWNETLYRVWYLIGAIYVAGWLGLGTVYLLRKTRFAYAFAVSLFLAGLFTFLTQAKYNYANSGSAPIIYFAVAALLAIGIVVLRFRGSERWADLAAVAIVGGSAVAAVLMVLAPIPAPGYFLNPETHIPVGDGLPGYIRLLAPFFNITGAFALGLGALYSAYMFMTKRRVIRYSISRNEGAARLAKNLLIAIVAVPINFLASLPGSIANLFRGRLNSRVPATILIAIGALIPAYTSGLNRFGDTGGFFVGEFLGVLFLFLGYLVSIEVMPTIRVPFTRVVLRERPPEPAS
jgi:hypothetical protein